MKPSEFVILTAVLASGIYTMLAKSGLAFFHITLIAVLAAIVFRMSAIHWRWHEIMPGAAAGLGEPGGRAPPAHAPRERFRAFMIGGLVYGLLLWG